MIVSACWRGFFVLEDPESRALVEMKKGMSNDGISCRDSKSPGARESSRVANEGASLGVFGPMRAVGLDFRPGA